MLVHQRWASCVVDLLLSTPLETSNKIFYLDLTNSSTLTWNLHFVLWIKDNISANKILLINIPNLQGSKSELSLLFLTYKLDKQFDRVWVEIQFYHNQLMCRNSSNYYLCWPHFLHFALRYMLVKQRRAGCIVDLLLSTPLETSNKIFCLDLWQTHRLLPEICTSYFASKTIHQQPLC